MQGGKLNLGKDSVQGEILKAIYEVTGEEVELNASRTY